MLDCKEGRLLRQVKREDPTMKINILLCDDDKDFLQRLTEVVTSQPLPPGISACVTKSAHSAAITDRQLSQFRLCFWILIWMNEVVWTLHGEYVNCIWTQ